MTTLATMVLELSLTRIFSVVFYYHFAFLAISIALFGLGAGGLFSYLFRGRSPQLFHRLGVLAMLNSACVLGALVFVLTREGDLHGITLALIYLSSALPFFLAGTVVATAISETVERVGRVYFFDLVGAAGGCLLLVPMLNLVGGPNTVIASAVLYSAAAAIWFTLGGSLRGRVVAVGVALALVSLIAVNVKSPLIDVRYAKGERLLEEPFVKWNSFSRVAVRGDAAVGELVIQIDADTSSPMAHLDLDALSDEARRELLQSPDGLAYLLRPGAKTLIISPGGGWPVARALASGSQDVTGVELNPIIANTVMRERYAGFTRGLYARPEVRMVVGDGRNFVRSTQESYQIIQVPMQNTWRSTITGALALSENSLLTTEAFADYLNRLAPEGIVVFSQWGFNPPRESLRVTLMARQALQEQGQYEPWNHVVVLRDRFNGHPRDTILVARSEFQEEDLSVVRELVAAGAADLLYLPGMQGGKGYAGLLRAADPLEFVEKYPYDVSPVTDNRPFFFYTTQVGDLLDFTNAYGGGAPDELHSSVPILLRLVGVTLLATAIVLTLPPVFLGTRIPRNKPVMRYLWYFVFIGAGYVMTQVTLIQEFVLFLGHPTYALTVIIFSMLVSSGLGSYFSRQITGTSERSLMGVLATVALLISVLAILIPPLTAAAAGWPLTLKVLATVFLIAPAGLVMGITFPAGLTRLRALDRPVVRWAWSLNAAASVMGSACAMFLGIHLGLRETLLIGAVLYLCALVSLDRRAGRRSAAPG